MRKDSFVLPSNLLFPLENNSIRAIGEGGRDLAINIFSALKYTCGKGVANGIYVNGKLTIVRYCRNGSVINQIRQKESKNPMIIFHAPSNSIFFGKGEDFYSSSKYQHSKSNRIQNWKHIEENFSKQIYPVDKKGFTSLKKVLATVY